MDWAPVLAIPAFLYYAFLCYKEAKQYQLDTLPKRILATSNYVKRYALWLNMAHSNQDEMRNFRWFSITGLFVSQFLGLLSFLSYHQAREEERHWAVLAITLLCYLACCAAAGLFVGGLLRSSLPVASGQLINHVTEERKMNQDKPVES